ncbi:MAG: YggT family protein [Anaerolineae bacterium]|jgi:hypothetical protein|nr:YggT family protein [Anaerolineae bacterium]
MRQDELRKQEQDRHDERVARNIEQHQAVNLDEKQRGITAANQNSTIARVVNIVYFIFGVLTVLLAIRVLLKLIGANAGNGFAYFIDTVSAPFVSLFAGLVQNPVWDNIYVLEITTLIAMLVWAIVAWLIGRLIWLAMSRPR